MCEYTYVDSLIWLVFMLSGGLMVMAGAWIGTLGENKSECPEEWDD